MRWILSLLAMLAMLIGLPGCAWMSTKSAILDAPQVQSLPPLGQKAQRAVDASNAALAVVYTFVRDGLKAQTLALKDADTILATADKYSDELDKLQDLIKIGSFDAVATRAAATQALIKLLHDQAVAAAQKRSEIPLLDESLQLLGA